MLQEKLDQVETRIANAAARSGRRRSDITLIAVTKKFPAAVIGEAYQLGLREFGENYVQEFEAKRRELAGCQGARYHLIGHLQSNKSKIAAEIFDVIQTVDTPKLARRLERGESPVRSHDRSEALERSVQSGSDARSCAGTCGCHSRLRQPALDRTDDDAALVE